MNIRAALLAEHSKRQTTKIVEYVGDDPARFKDLIDNFLGDTYRVSQRAAWAVSNCIEQHPELVKPYYSRLLSQLERTDSHVAVRRNVVRLLQFVDVPARYRGRIFDVCYKLFADIGQPVAVRVFAMTVAGRIANNNPELLDELRLIAKQHPEAATAGLRSRARRVLGI